MTKVICIGTQKGGVGKTTLTLLVAMNLQALGKRVLLVDADDPQHSITKVRQRELLGLQRDPVLKQAFDESNVSIAELITGSIPEAAGAVPMAKSSGMYDYIFIDLPGTVNIDGLGKLGMSMDYLITPMEMDPKTFASGCASIEMYHRLNPALKIGMVWNRIKKSESTSLMHGINKYFDDALPYVNRIATVVWDITGLKRAESTIYPCANKVLLELMEELFRENGFIG